MNAGTQRAIFWILVLLLMFGLGVGATFVWLGAYSVSLATPGPASPSAGLAEGASDRPILAFCELANNPEKYDGKIVRVSARLWYAKHGYFFLSKNCDGDARQAAVTVPGDGRWQQIESKIAKDLGLADANYTPWEFPEIIAVGKFSSVEPSRKSDATLDNTHLLFELIEVERASNIRAE